MQCFSAITTANGPVPCGQCINCRVNKGRRWTGRLLLEYSYLQRSSAQHRDWFFTFTYDQEHVPRQHGLPSLEKKTFLKWVNNTANRVCPLRYFAVGEYGDNTARPHYHMAAFDLTLDQARGVTAAWKSGFVSFADFNQERAAYLCGYTTKKLTVNKNQPHSEIIEPEFRTSSRRPPIGHAAVSGIVNSFRSGGGQKTIQRDGDIPRTFRYRGKLYPIDRYILTKVRKELHIPETHTGRGDESFHYLLKYPTLEAENCAEKATFAKQKYQAKQSRRRANRNSV